MEDIEVVDEYRRAYELAIRNEKAIFVTGRAGTGKSTFIRYISSILQDTVVLAPTASAAINAGGETIHSFFGFPARHIEPNERFKLRPKSKEVIKALKVLLIDEVSMVTPNIVDAMDAILRKRRRSALPFGGVSVIFVGDLLQLPPIITTNEEKTYFKERYESRFFFCADVFKQIQIAFVELQKVRRQQNGEFVDFLGNVRDGSNIALTVNYFNSNCLKPFSELKEPIWLVSTNAAAHSINSKKLALLGGETKVYEADNEGETENYGKKIGAPERLELKLGAKVVFVRNNRQKGWINGDTGTVVSFGSDTITVISDVTGEALEVCRMSWERYAYTYDEKSKQIEKEIIGSVIQFPLMLGWALTIHKSQGMTLESVVVDLGGGAFCEGQTYVALSRCKSIEKMRIAKTLAVKDIKVDEEALKFYKNFIQ